MKKIISILVLAFAVSNLCADVPVYSKEDIIVLPMFSATGEDWKKMSRDQRIEFINEVLSYLDIIVDFTYDGKIKVVNRDFKVENMYSTVNMVVYMDRQPKILLIYKVILSVALELK